MCSEDGRANFESSYSESSGERHVPCSRLVEGVAETIVVPLTPPSRCLTERSALLWPRLVHQLYCFPPAPFGYQCGIVLPSQNRPACLRRMNAASSPTSK